MHFKSIAQTLQKHYALHTFRCTANSRFFFLFKHFICKRKIRFGLFTNKLHTIHNVRFDCKFLLLLLLLWFFLAVTASMFAFLFIHLRIVFILSIWIHIDDFSIHPYRSSRWVFLLPVVIYGCSANISFFVLSLFLFLSAWFVLFLVLFFSCCRCRFVFFLEVLWVVYEIWITCAFVHGKI